jgi:hypothetical protein
MTQRFKLKRNRNVNLGRQHAYLSRNSNAVSWRNDYKLANDATHHSVPWAKPANLRFTQSSVALPRPDRVGRASWQGRGDAFDPF